MGKLLLYSQDGKGLSDWAMEPWNEMGFIPICDWLDSEQGAEQRARLSAMGNIVVPRQAQLAVQCCLTLVSLSDDH